MRPVLGIATAFGAVGPIAVFGLFYLRDQVFHLERPHLQSLDRVKLLAYRIFDPVKVADEYKAARSALAAQIAE